MIHSLKKAVVINIMKYQYYSLDKYIVLKNTPCLKGIFQH